MRVSTNETAHPVTFRRVILGWRMCPVRDVNEHDLCGHVLRAIPASLCQLPDVFGSLFGEQQAWMRWWGAPSFCTLVDPLYTPIRISVGPWHRDDQAVQCVEKCTRH